MPPGGRAVVLDLDDVPLGQREQLQAYGVAPGRTVDVLQTRPVMVVRADNAEIAFEAAVAGGVRVEVTGA